MTVEERHAANNWISKIHNQIYRAAVGDVHGIDPYWIFHRLFVDGIDQKVDLMDVKRMHFFAWVHDAPVLQGTDIHREHWAGIHFEFLAIYVEALFVFSEPDNELRFTGFDTVKNCRRKACVNRRYAVSTPDLNT